MVKQIDRQNERVVPTAARRSVNNPLTDLKQNFELLRVETKDETFYIRINRIIKQYRNNERKKK